ncbi:MAG: hypothetical protein LBQ33_07480 [Oscillospiraceae bacterium]|jgi:hypothetical protein|nr:hypothetical protein [Oscillospiraceae bacterium]
MKSLKKGVALLLTLLLVFATFAVSASADEGHFFEAGPNAAEKYAYYTDLLTQLNTPAEGQDVSLARRYQALLDKHQERRYDAETGLNEEEQAEFAEVKAKYDEISAKLMVPVGATFLANYAFDTTASGPPTKRDRACVAFVALKLMPGALQNDTYNKRYSKPAETDLDEDGKADVDENGNKIFSYPIDRPTYAAVSPKRDLDIANTIYQFAPEGEYDDSVLKNVAPTHYLFGRFGYLIGSNNKDLIQDQTVLQVPGINGKALASFSILKDTGRAYYTIGNPAGMYPLYPNRMTLTATSFSQNYRYYGDLTDTAVLDKLPSIDYTCTYDTDTAGGTAQAKFAGWKITKIEQLNVNSEDGASHGLAPYQNYYITLEAQWELDPAAAPPVVYSPPVAVRTWNWLIQRLTNWALLGQNPDPDSSYEFGALMNGLIDWLLGSGNFVNWLWEMTGIDLMDILESFGVKLG